ncbi:phage minor capsid protein [Peribacillus frigoritolerans]|uniref:phage minor capsid protein n=1 Tax=Peribacillus frigoritolerans TaxID=450367 RepID=UPI003D068D07
MNQEQLIKHINGVMEDIFNSASSVDDLMNDKKKLKLIKSITESLDRLGLTLVQIVPGLLNDSYQEGMDEAAVALREVVASAMLEGMSPTEKAAVILKALDSDPTAIQKRIHLEAVNSMAEDTIMDMQAAIRTAKQSVNTAITDTLEQVKTELVKSAITGDTRKRVTERVMKKFAQDGLTSFITRDGKKLPLDFYARTVVATKTRDAHVSGANQRYQEAGVDLAQIFENSDTCPICSKYSGMVVSLTGDTKGFKTKDEVRLPPYHPNCRGTTRPYVQEFKTPEEIQAEKDKWKKWEPEKDTRTPAQRKAYEKEQAIRRKANEEKKQFIRYQSVLGAEAPKTLGAFRRMKRSNSLKYQELQSMYRSKARESIS